MSTRQRMKGFQKPKTSHYKKVGLARISYHSDGHVECSCGWTNGHSRSKVREDAIDRHLVKQHGGRGIRL
jgi:hypothetical protein